MPGGVGVLMRLADASKGGTFEQFAVMVEVMLDLVEEPADREAARALVMQLSIDELQGFFDTEIKP